MTPENRNDFLKSVYEFQIVQGNPSVQINKKENNQYREELSLINYWSEKGLIDKVSSALGYTIIKLTSRGIDYVEENLS